MGAASVILLVAAFLVPGLGIGLFQLGFISGPEYTYRVNAGAHFDNAFDASTFDVMRDNLRLAITGLHALGLQSQDCGRAFSWERTQDWCMGYQYTYLEGLVNRTEYYIRIFAENNTSPFTDIYTQSIANVRAEFGRNGPVDWVAFPAFLLKHHGLYYWGGLVWIFLLIIGGLLMFAAVIVSEEYY